jgi:hypothetical protein
MCGQNTELGKHSRPCAASVILSGAAYWFWDKCYHSGKEQSAAAFDGMVRVKSPLVAEFLQAAGQITGPIMPY